MKKPPTESDRNPWGITELAEYEAERLASLEPEVAPRVAHSLAMWEIWVIGYIDQFGNWQPPRLDPENPTRANPDHGQSCEFEGNDVAGVYLRVLNAVEVGLDPSYDAARATH